MHRSYNRRKFLKVSGFGLLAFLVSRMGSAAAEEKEITYVKNINLETIKKGYRGNRLVNNRFVNDKKGFTFPLFRIIKWMFTPNPQREEKANDSFRLTVIKNDTLFSGTEDRIVWLGHASFFIRLNGKTIMTDPCLTNPPFYKRYSELPCPIEAFRGIDYLLISHNHMDHCDSDTLERISLKGTMALVPLRMGETLRSFNDEVHIQEAGWFQKYDTGDDDIAFYLVPTRHFSNRSLWDRNRSLWGSFVITAKGKSIYFSGDAAYSSHFKEIRELFPRIDICLMTVGAYKPRYLTEDIHASPEEAVRAFHDLKGTCFIPMHYGTFDITDEPLCEPVRILQKLEQDKKIQGELKILDVGEIFRI